VERTSRWLNRVRRILVRWQKQAANDSALVHLAGAFIAFHQAGLVG
jgi:transposase